MSLGTSHVAHVARLYKRALKLSLDWIVKREEWQYLSFLFSFFFELNFFFLV
jgi:hypothetical protein